VFFDSLVLGFLSRARVRCRGFCRPFCRGFRRGVGEKCLILTAVCAGNPGQDRMVLGRKCSIVTALSGRVDWGEIGAGSRVVVRRVDARRDWGDERSRARRGWHTTTERPVGLASEQARVGDLPTVCVSPPADTAEEDQLAGGEQRLTRACRSYRPAPQRYTAARS
jgi:hypothetical protein